MSVCRMYVESTKDQNCWAFGRGLINVNALGPNIYTWCKKNDNFQQHIYLEKHLKENIWSLKINVFERNISLNFVGKKVIYSIKFKLI